MKGESTVTGAYTEDDGRYNIPAVEVGTYSLLISFPGAKPVTVNGIVVSAGENTYVEAIDIGLGSTEVVEVKAPAIERGVTQKVTFSGTDLVRIG
ncbi:MAG: carboxypeptidase-like regulatory domain-containing protein, partial [Sphingobacteriia bacterium]